MTENRPNWVNAVLFGLIGFGPLLLAAGVLAGGQFGVVCGMVCAYFRYYLAACAHLGRDVNGGGGRRSPGSRSAPRFFGNGVRDAGFCPGDHRALVIGGRLVAAVGGDSQYRKMIFI